MAPARRGSGLGDHLGLAVGMLDHDRGSGDLHDKVVLELEDDLVGLLRGGLIGVADDDKIHTVCHFDSSVLRARGRPYERFGGPGSRGVRVGPAHTGKVPGRSGSVSAAGRGVMTVRHGWNCDWRTGHRGAAGGGGVAGNRKSRFRGA
jgi:hypothetical protein